MKFSVLLPTRNGGKFLRNCIASVLEQPYHDIELIVSDNANTDETPSVVASFQSDPRLKYIRLDEPVEVTENWNRALAASQGEYILMIGDDDCLLPGYFERLEQLIERYDHPDCIVYNAYGYVFPGAIDTGHNSYYAEPHFTFGPEYVEGLIPASTRLAIVRDMFRFRVRYPLNMQLTLVSRRAADRIEGGIFQPPFPDHYALNALLLEAGTFAYCPEKLVVVGLSPKSFGHYGYRDQQAAGMDYLGSDGYFEGRLPGSEWVNSIHVWLVKLRAKYRSSLGEIAVSRPDYVRHQVFAWYLQLRFGSLSSRELLGRCRALSPGDWLGLALSFFDAASRARLRRMVQGGLTSSVQNKRPGLKSLAGIRDIREFALVVSRPGNIVGTAHPDGRRTGVGYMRVTEKAQQLFRCPTCTSRLTVSEGKIVCTNGHCRTSFPIVGGIPILINEASSVFSFDDFVQQRSTTFKPVPRVARLVSDLLPQLGQNLVARANFGQFAPLLFEQSNNPVVLVIGGSIVGEGMHDILALPDIEFVETDVALGPRTMLVCDAHDLPFDDGSFHGVIMQAVLEHVADPYRCVEEVHRVLKENGVVYAETPFMQQVHMGRYDFTRFTHLGHRRLFRRFAEHSSGIVAGPGTVLAWSCNYFLLGFVRSKAAISFVKGFTRLTLFWLKYFDRYLNEKRGALDGASCYYFMGSRSRETLADRELIKQYKGIL